MSQSVISSNSVGGAKSFAPLAGFRPELLIRDTKIALNRLGYYRPDPQDGMTFDEDAGFLDALTAYKKIHTIPLDEPYGPGTITQRILNEELARESLSMRYIWRTVGDEKVRSEHKMRHGQTYYFSRPPADENPGEDYNCRCWAEILEPPRHPWMDWVNDRRENRIKEKSILQEHGRDAITPVYPLETLLGGGFIAKNAARLAITSLAKMRDTSWIRKTPQTQFQKKFKHAKEFGINGNQNKNSINAYKEALEDHIKSRDTIIIKGTYHKEPVKHYYNSRTRINVIRNEKGDFVSAWKLEKDQIFYLTKTGKLGGSR